MDHPQNITPVSSKSNNEVSTKDYA